MAVDGDAASFAKAGPPGRLETLGCTCPSLPCCRSLPAPAPGRGWRAAARMITAPPCHGRD